MGFFVPTIVVLVVVVVSVGQESRNGYQRKLAG